MALGARALRLSPQVALRPEPFGALAYHYGTRRLVFLKHPDVVRVVASLAEHPSVDATLDACLIAADRRAGFHRAIAGLLDSGLLVPSTEPERRAAEPTGCPSSAGEAGQLAGEAEPA